MKNIRVLAWTALAATILLTGVVLLAQASRPGDTMQLWEYRTEIMRERGLPPETRTEGRRGAGPADAMLNGLGGAGWELVAVTRREVRVDDTIQTETMFTLKRSMRSVNR